VHQTIVMHGGTTKQLEIHENDRYWVATGWGGLLPNDRGRFSYTDGSKSWKTLEDTPLPLGFEFEQGSNWEFSKQYFYARDFTRAAIANAKPHRNGALHWVRFRSVSRTLRLNPNLLLPSHNHHQCTCCQSCDSKTVFGLADYLLEALTYCCILSSDFKLATIEHYKRELLQVTRAQHDHLLDGEHTSNNNPDAFYSYQVLLQELGNLVDQKRQKITHIFSNLPSFADRETIADFSEQMNDKIKPHFTERTMVAMLVIKNLDPMYQLHCNKIGTDCGPECQFRWVQCPNPDCTTIVSQLYQQDHDQECPFKIISCDCGDSFPRHQQRKHQTQVCSLRPTTCPFKAIGCTSVAQAKDMGEHVSHEVSSHLLMAMDRLLEHEAVMRNMKQRIQTLESENVQLKNRLVTAAGDDSQAISTLQRKLTSMEQMHKKDVKRLQDDIKKLQNELFKIKPMQK
jgi:hypothetical protein